MFRSIRARLSLWYAFILALVLAGFVALSYTMFVRLLHEEVDANLKEVAGNVARAIKSEQEDEDQIRSPSNAIEEGLQSFRFRDYQVAIFTQDGSSVAQTFQEQLPPRLSNAISEGQAGGVVINDEPFRAYAQAFRINDAPYRLYAFYSLRDQVALEHRIEGIYVSITPFILVIAGLGGYLIARRGLKPISVMRDRARHLTAANLHERLPVLNERDEVGELAMTFNELLDRLHKEFDRQRRFMADASHELRTPLSIVRGESEVALMKMDRTKAEYRDSLGIVNDESKRLTKIVDDLFTLARADAGAIPVEFKDVYLDELLADCVRSVRRLAEARSIDIELETEELCVKGDETLLRRMLMNLLDNAIKYNYDGGLIDIRVATKFIRIGNTGQDIPGEHADMIFERFYRETKERAADDQTLMSGAGLGLSIAKVIAELHQARLTYNRVGIENVFSVTLPH